MKREREIIAKSNLKSFFLLIFGLSIIGLPIWSRFLEKADTRWLGIFFVSSIIFMALLSLSSFIIFPNEVIWKEDEEITVRLGVFFKEKLAVTSITGAEVVPHKNGDRVSNHGYIQIKTVNENGEERTINISVQNKVEVVEKITALIKA